MNIDTMQAGPEFDFLIGTKVMGWRLECFADAKQTPIGWTDGDAVAYVAPPTWSPSTNIAHAWQVVGKIGDGPFSKRHAFTEALRHAFPVGNDYRSWPDAIFQLLPIDICRAALHAVQAR